MLFNSIRGYVLAQTQYQYERLRQLYPFLYASAIIVPLVLVAIGIELNFAGARYWNLILSLIPGIALGFVLLRPQLYPWLLAIGTLNKLTDGVRNTPAEVVTGGIQLLRKLLLLVGHVSLVAQTALTLLAVWQFESRGMAYVAVCALIGMSLAIVLFLKLNGRVYGSIMLTFWILLFVGSLASAMFIPSYFSDQSSYWIRHAQGEQQDNRRIARRNELLAMVEAGKPLTLDQRAELQFLNNQERAVGQVISTQVSASYQLKDGLPEEPILVAIKPGSYTCQAEITARNPEDLTVALGTGGTVDLATTAYINRQPCNGKAKVDFGPDGQATLHWNLDPDARATVKAATRWVRVTFTPA